MNQVKIEDQCEKWIEVEQEAVTKRLLALSYMLKKLRISDENIFGIEKSVAALINCKSCSLTIMLQKMHLSGQFIIDPPSLRDLK